MVPSAISTPIASGADPITSMLGPCNDDDFDVLARRSCLLRRTRRANENPFHRGSLPLASVRPWFLRASPPIGSKYFRSALSGDEWGRPHLSANANNRNCSCSDEREAYKARDEPTHGHLLFPPTLNKLLLSHHGGGTSVSGQLTGPFHGETAATPRSRVPRSSLTEI
jgi:hypothetical protein